jgi:hypothetical protein
MKQFLLVVVLGVFTACSADPDEPIDSQESSVIDGDKLPGGCNNPLLCRTGTPPGDEPGGGGGGGQQMCSGCVCSADPQACASCESRCHRQKFECVINGGGEENCRAARTQCISDCGLGLTCVCPR